MDKLKMHSPDLSQENIAKIRDLFVGDWTSSADVWLRPRHIAPKTHHGQNDRNAVTYRFRLPCCLMSEKPAR